MSKLKSGEFTIHSSFAGALSLRINGDKASINMIGTGSGSIASMYLTPNELRWAADEMRKAADSLGGTSRRPYNSEDRP